MNSFIDIKEYSYDLPSEKIAHYPLQERDQSKFLVYRDGKIVHSRFDALEEFIPPNALLFVNDTKVIPARLLFQKNTGAEIEIFLLTPVSPSSVQLAMQSTGTVQWQCAIGNLKRWKDGTALVRQNENGIFRATLVSRDKGIVAFNSSPLRPFAEVVQEFGETPLPPYIKRKAEPGDRERYQTVYSEAPGAVAAPTAGLHFTDPILKRLRKKGVLIDFLTLHVSAGTFLPVKVPNAIDHDMHAEQLLVSKSTLQNLLSLDRPVFAVGTTSLRTLESLYWYGTKLLSDPGAEFKIQKSDPYHQQGSLPSRKESFQAIADRMEKGNLESLAGETSIFIVPGYSFQVVDGLITNFHQPQSTLLLLIAAFVGPDWKTIYNEALEQGYRFLSYGDSSLLFRNNEPNNS